MSLSERQAKFTLMVALLIQYAYLLGYSLTFGDAYSKVEFGVHSLNSFHYKRLAIDLNLFIDGEYQTTTKAYKYLGEFWELIGGTWGGNFPDGQKFDGNHFEYKI